MKSLNRSFYFVAAAITGGLTLGAVALSNKSTSPTELPITVITQQSQEPQSYIIQGTNSENLAAVVNNVGGNVSREFPIINAISAVLTPSQAEKIKQLGNVRVQNDHRVMTMGGVGIGGALTFSPDNGTIDNYITRQIDAQKLHDMGITGRGVTVAVVDSGANLGGSTGRFLFRGTSNQARIPVKYNAITKRINYRWNDDQNGHGTHVSNIIASSVLADNGNYNGIAPDVNLLPVKAFNAKGESSYSKVLDALNWIFENRYRYRIKIVNLSMGAEPRSRYWNDPINQAVMRLWDAGIVVVTSAGNNGEEMGISVPGNTPYVITVGAMTDNHTPHDDSDDRITTFSAKGPTFEGFVKPELVAPGARVAVKMDVGLIARWLKKSKRNPMYTEISGTSQASAVVAGVVAMMVQNDPFITPDNVKCKLVATARAAKARGNLAYSPFEQGAGVINAYDAVMSQASNCANQGLNIAQDLMGKKHFFGPVVKQNSKFRVLTPSGAILTEGTHWANGNLALEATKWSSGMLGLEGTHWDTAKQALQGAHWSKNIMGLEAAHWDSTNIALEGANWVSDTLGLEGIHWTQNDVNLEGMHWAQGEMTLEGALWGDGDMGLESFEDGLNPDPIDPSIELSIDESAWQ